MTLLDSLLDAIVRLDGEALIMHAGEKPFVVLSSASESTYRGPLSWGQVELSSRPLTTEALVGMLAQMLSMDQSQMLEDVGAIEHEIAAPGHSDERFIVTAARGGDDVWVEVRRRPKHVEPAVEQAAPADVVIAPAAEHAPMADAVARLAAERLPPVAIPVVTPEPLIASVAAIDEGAEAGSYSPPTGAALDGDAVDLEVSLELDDEEPAVISADSLDGDPEVLFEIAPPTPYVQKAADRVDTDEIGAGPAAAFEISESPESMQLPDLMLGAPVRDAGGDARAAAAAHAAKEAALAAEAEAALVARQMALAAEAETVLGARIAALAAEAEAVLAAREAALNAENQSALTAREAALAAEAETAVGARMALLAAEAEATQAAKEAALAAEAEAKVGARMAGLAAEAQAALAAKESALEARADSVLAAKIEALAAEAAAALAARETALASAAQTALAAKEAALAAEAETALAARIAALTGHAQAALAAREAEVAAHVRTALAAKGAALGAELEAAVAAKEAALAADAEAALGAKIAALSKHAEAALAAREAEVAAHVRSALAAKGAALGAELEAAIAAKEAALAADAETALAAKLVALAKKVEAALAAREAALAAEAETTLAGKVAALAEHAEATLTAREAALTAREAALTAQAETTLAGKVAALAEHAEATLTAREAALAAREVALAARSERAIGERIAALTAEAQTALAEKESALASAADAALAEKEAALAAAADAALAEKEAALTAAADAALAEQLAALASVVQPALRARSAAADRSAAEPPSAPSDAAALTATASEAGQAAAELVGETQAAVVVPIARPSLKLQPPAPQPEAPAASTEASLVELLRAAAGQHASTLYAVVDTRPMMRVEGRIALAGTHAPIVGGDVERFIFEFAPREQVAHAAPEWTCTVPGVGRVRCVTFHDHSGAGLIFHLPTSEPTSADELGLGREVQSLCSEADGLVVVAGSRSSGKSTLLNAFVDLINRTRYDHVITIESQIRVVHEKRYSFISQREVRGDGDAIAEAARAALREGPDVLVIEDLRAPEALVAALDAARAGRLVFGSISASTAPVAVERLIDAFPAERRPQVRASLAGALRAVVAQVLVPRTAGGRIAAREVLLSSPAVRKLILHGATWQLPIAIESGRNLGMNTMVDSLGTLVRDGVVDIGDACALAPDRAGLIAALQRDGVDVSQVERRA